MQMLVVVVVVDQLGGRAIRPELDHSRFRRISALEVGMAADLVPPWEDLMLDEDRVDYLLAVTSEGSHVSSSLASDTGADTGAGPSAAAGSGSWVRVGPSRGSGRGVWARESCSSDMCSILR